MTSWRPRTALSTHTVTNQPPPLGDVHLFDDDPLFARAFAAGLAASQADASHQAAQTAHVRAFAGDTGREEWREAGAAADANPPTLRAFDRYGHRIDEVTFHPAYHALMAHGLGAGVASRAWTHPEAGHTAHAALMMLMSWADFGVCCPMSMTYAAQPVLRATPWAREAWAGAALGPYDPAVRPIADKAGATIGMAMTEKQGGSDVRANTTRAEAFDAAGGDDVILTGHKWFCSAPMCDAFLTLAHEDAGLSCFLVPRWTPDGDRNALEIQRLKDKLGDRSNASSEIEYRGAWARRLGEPGRGVRTIIDMVHHTRLDCLVGSAATVRIALAHALHHTAHRRAFDGPLIDQPAMRGVLADLALEAIGGCALAFRVAGAFDAAATDPAEAAFARVATPIAKYWLCKRAPNAVYEALECFGGAGYVEESGMPRLYRQSPLNAIWEGSGNVIALDVVRAITRDAGAFDALVAEVETAVGQRHDLDGLIAWIKDAPGHNGLADGQARVFVERCALALTAAALHRMEHEAAFDALVRLRIAEPFHMYGAGSASVDADALIEEARLRA